MFKFYHVSDLHFHSDNKDNQEVIIKLARVRFLMEPFAGDEKYLLVTGDITDDGHPEQYKNALEALSQFPVGRVFVSPGNHDVGGSGILYHEACARSFDELTIKLGYQRTYFPKKSLVSHLVSDQRSNKLLVIGLNGCLQTASPFDWSCGKLGKNQLAQLQVMLENPGVSHIPRLIHMHYHPFMHTDPTMKLIDADKLLKVISGKADVFCFGHKHESNVWGESRQPWNPSCLYVAAGTLPRLAKIWEISIEMLPRSGGGDYPKVSVQEITL